MAEAGNGYDPEVSERRKLNRKDPLTKRLERERDDPTFVIPDGARVITLKSWSKDKVAIDVASFTETYTRDTYGLVKPKALPAEKVEARVRSFRALLRSDSRLWQRGSTIAKRTSIRNTNRPQSTSPVKGFGLKLFGQEVNVLERRLQDKVISNTIPPEVDEALANRLQKEFAYIKRVDECRIKATSKANTDVVRFLDEAEKHQVLTGGGYDNTHVGQARQVSFDWINKVTTHIEDTKFSDIVMRNLNRLKAQYDDAGILPGTLDLVDYSLVRDLSNTDGTIGFPILAHGKDVFTVDIANSIRDVYGVDMRSYVGAYVKLENYTGPVRVKDALNDLPFLMSSIGPEQLWMLVYQLSRTQRKGYKKLGVPKDGKFRSIKMPEALHAIFSGAVATAFKIKSQEGRLPAFLAGQLPYQEQIDAIFSEVKSQFELGNTGFPLDESAFDASLLCSVMATIILDVYRPLFKQEYWPVFEVIAFGFCNKIILTPILEEEDRYYASHGILPPRVPERSYFVKGWCLTYCQDKLLSGDYLTQHLGSNYNKLVVQDCTYDQLGYSDKVSYKVGKALGDDVLMYIPMELIQRIGIEAVLALIERALANYSIEANPSKQYIIKWSATGEYLVVFLQRYYCASANIKGIGSPARSAAGCPFSEYSPLESQPPQNMALQDIGVISTYNNGFNHPLIDDWVEFLFSEDEDLKVIFQVYGESAFRILTESAGGEQAVKDAMSHLAYSPASGASAVIGGQPLPIVDIMARVARSMGSGTGRTLPNWLTLNAGPVVGTNEESEPAVTG